MPDLDPNAAVTGNPPVPMQPQNSPAQASLTPPAQPAPQQQPTLQPGQMASAAGASAQPAKPGSFFHNLSHAMVGSVLGALAGDKDTTGYSVDETGKMTPLTRPMSTVDKLRKIAANALVGLAAGSQAPEGKSGLASGLSGLGAGAGAVQQKAQQQDEKMRGQANEDFERQQKAALQKMEMMKGNAILLGLHYNNVRSQNELDPEVTTGKADWEQVQKVPELANHATVVTGEQLADLHKKDAEGDSHFDNTHIILKLGSAPELDENGNPIKGADGEIKNVSRFAIINGAQAMKDSPKAGMPISAEMANDIHRFGSLGPTPIPGAENIKAGDAIPLDQWVVLRNNILESKKNVMQGWQNSKIAFQTGPDGKEVMGEINPNLPAGDPERFRPFGATVPASAEDEKNKIAEGVEKTKLTKAQTAEASAKAQEAIANAQLAHEQAVQTKSPEALQALNDAISQLPNANQAKAVLRSYDPATQSAILAVAAGDGDLNKVFPTRVTKGSLQVDASHAAGIIRLIDPTWNEQRYTTNQGTLKDFMSGETSKNITALNTAVGHLDQLGEAAKALQTGNVQVLNQLANRFGAEIGKSPIITYNAVKAAVEGEVAKVYKGSGATDQEIATIGKVFEAAQSPAQAEAAVKATLGLFGSRLEALKSQFKNGTGHDPSRYGVQLVNPESQKIMGKYGLGGETGMTRIQASDGTFHDIPSDKLADAQKIDPKLQVVKQ